MENFDWTWSKKPRLLQFPSSMKADHIIANGRETAAELPCTIEAFLLAQGLLPRSVVVEHIGEAVAPSEFYRRQIVGGDRIEVVKIVAGG